MKIIIFEGLDNTGKSTQIDLLKKDLEDKQLRVYAHHFSKPEGNMTNVEKAAYQDKEYMDFIQTLIDYKNNCTYDYVLIDRCWYSEYVYGQIYRDRDEFEVHFKLNMFEDNLINYFDKDDLHLLIFTVSHPEFLIEHEDGLSLSANDIKKIQHEMHLFNMAYVNSNIESKNFIYADTTKDNKALKFNENNMIIDNGEKTLEYIDRNVIHTRINKFIKINGY